MLWKIPEHSETDKSFEISGPIGLKVDYDDVDHEEVDAVTEKVVRILNKHWDEE